MPAAVYLRGGSRSVLVDRGGGDLPVHTFKTHSVGIGVIARHVPHFTIQLISHGDVPHTVLSRH